VDSDDLLTPWALERLRYRLAASPSAPFAYGCALAVSRSADGSWSHQGVIASTRDELRDPVVSLFIRNRVPASGALVRTDAITKVGGYDPSVQWSEDHHLWLRLATVAPPAYLPEIVCAYRRHEGNRYSHTNGGVDDGAVLALAETDPRLRNHLPERIGVMLLEAVTGAPRECSPG
jgi:hypothetical protein